MPNLNKPSKPQTPNNKAPGNKAPGNKAPGPAPGASLEPSAAEAAFQSLGATFAEMPRDVLFPINVDVQVAAVFALGVSRFASEEGVRTRFSQLAKSGEYDDSVVDWLAPAAQAAWYARHRYLLETATRSEAQLPAALVDVAFALRGRMLRLAEYWLSDDLEAAAELAAIRIGSGHQDLANDLVALAALCDRHQPLLSQDKKLYQAGDTALAKQLAGEILERLGASATAEQSKWLTAQARAWTFLARTYEEVRRGGRFLFPNQEGEERFPSLVSVARAAAVRGVKEEAPAPGANGTAGGPTAKENVPPA